MEQHWRTLKSVTGDSDSVQADFEGSAKLDLTLTKAETDHRDLNLDGKMDTFLEDAYNSDECVVPDICSEKCQRHIAKMQSAYETEAATRHHVGKKVLKILWL